MEVVFIATTVLGLEAIVKRELLKLGYRSGAHAQPYRLQQAGG